MQVLVAITTLFTSIELKYNTKDLKMKDLCYQYTIDTYATKRSEKKDDLKKCESFVVWRQENTRRLELKSECLTIERVYNTDSISISIKRVFMQVIFRNHRHRLFPTSLTRKTCVSNYDQIMFCVCIKIKQKFLMYANQPHPLLVFWANFCAILFWQKIYHREIKSFQVKNKPILRAGACMKCYFLLKIDTFTKYVHHQQKYRIYNTLKLDLWKEGKMWQNFWSYGRIRTRAFF